MSLIPRKCDREVTRAFQAIWARVGDKDFHNFTASRLVATDSNKKFASVSDLTSWIAGTTNQITVTDDTDGTVTLSTPQDIAASSSPTFVDLTLSSPSNIYTLSHDSFADFVANEHIDHTSVTISAGTGLTGGGDISTNRTLSLSFLGLESLTDPDADRILFWDDSESKIDWLGLGNSVAITTTTFDTIQDIRTSASPQFVLITLTGTPTIATDSVNKAYADSLVGGAFWNNVAVATIANVDLSADLEAGDTIDDYTLVAGDRVLVKEQTDATENGLYVVPASGAASRATDADEEAEILNKKCIPTNGALTANHLYFCVNSSITIGVTDIEFAELTTVADHNSLSALQGGQAGPPTEYYHLTSARHTTLSAIGDLAVTDGNFIVGNGSTWVAESGATVRISLGLTIGSDVQAFDAGLTSLAGLTYVSDSFIKVTAEDTYAIRTIAETKTDLSLNNVENTAISTWAGSANIVTVGTLTSGAIGAGFTSISTSYTDAKCTATWPNTYTSDQDIQTTDSPTFANLSLGTGELTCGSVNRASGTLTLEVGGTAEVSITSTESTFGGNIVIPDAGTIGSATDVDIMTLAADGTCTFSVFPVTPSAAPDADYEVANKKYVDDNAGGGGASEITFEAKDRIGPSSSFATLDTLTGGSTPAEIIDVLDFDASSSEYADFKSTLFAGYANGGLTLVIAYSMTSDADEATPHKVRWEAALRRVNDDAEVITASHTYQFNGVSDIVPSELGELSYATITFTDGADMDSLDAGEKFILRIYRDHDHADDNATGDAEFWSVTITET